jgi:3-oxoacyl-[acyl-carrier protein] reductase
MKLLLEGKCAVVTGGTKGIGKAIALKFAQEGAQVIVYGTNPERLSKVLEELHLISSKKHAVYQVDVSSKEQVDKAATLILEEIESLDILVNNAGITKDNLLLKMTEEEWDSVMAVNAKSCYTVTKSFIRSMIKKRSGSVINITSIVGGVRGNPGQTNYAASKAAIVGFTQSLAREVGSRKVRINAIAPGFIETEMTEILSENQKKEILLDIPLNRMGTAEEVANAAIFLASHLSDYITGQVLVVDGGKVS